MWYEAIPPMVIISVVLWIPSLAGKHLNQFMFGNPFRRDMTECFSRQMFFRDANFGNLPWETMGLDHIPDEPKKE